MHIHSIYEAINSNLTIYMLAWFVKAIAFNSIVLMESKLPFSSMYPMVFVIIECKSILLANPEFVRRLRIHDNKNKKCHRQICADKCQM